MIFKDFNHVHNWIEENVKKLSYVVSVSECKKWDKCFNYNETPFPCVCPTRNNECIFIETYYEVYKAFLLIQKEQEYLQALEQYYKIKCNKNAVLEWVKYYEPIGTELLHFNPIIKIKIKQEPYEVKQIVLPENELQNLLKFKDIFTEYYCSDKYENY